MDALNRALQEPDRNMPRWLTGSSARPLESDQANRLSDRANRFAPAPPLIHGDGTSEARWASLGRLDTLPGISLLGAGGLLNPRGRAVIVAPHPDDEVLGTGGLLAALAATGQSAMLLAATDGTASHPGSTRWGIDDLARARPLETQRALRRLGWSGGNLSVQRAGFPDGELQAHQAELEQWLLGLLRPGDTVFATWRHDGHPDHEAVGSAAARATMRCAARLVEVPIWAWHWAAPGDSRLPWSRARRFAFGAALLEKKRAALRAFVSQARPDPSTGRGAILPAAVRARFVRPFEVFFV